MIQLSLNIKTTTNINDLKYNINMGSILTLEPAERNVKAEYNLSDAVESQFLRCHFLLHLCFW